MLFTQRSSCRVICLIFFNSTLGITFNNFGNNNKKDIQESLKELVQAGISSECYYSLANLECIACDPNQTIVMQPDGTVEDGSSTVLIDQIFTMRLCTELCKDIYNSCSDASSAAALGVTSTSNYVEFCESIDGSLLTADTSDVTGIFYSANFLVTEFDCYAGVPKSDIESDVGVCLNSFEDCLIPSNTSYINYYVNDSSSLSFSLLLLILALSFLLL